MPMRRLPSSHAGGSGSGSGSGRYSSSGSNCVSRIMASSGMLARKLLGVLNSLFYHTLQLRTRPSVDPRNTSHAKVAANSITSLGAAAGFCALWRDVSSLHIHGTASVVAIVVAHPIGEITAAGFVAALGCQIEIQVGTDEEFVTAAEGRVGMEEVS